MSHSNRRPCHRNAPMTPTGRARMVDFVVHQGASYRAAADRFQVSTATVAKWVRRHRAGESLQDRSSRPRHCPHQTPVHVEDRIVDIRRTRRIGPARIAWELGLYPTDGAPGAAPAGGAVAVPHRPGHRRGHPPTGAAPLRLGRPR